MPLMLLIACLSLLLLLALLAARSSAAGPEAPNLGLMSRQWLAEYRASHPG